MKIIEVMDTHKFPCPQGDLLKTQLDMFSRVLWADVAPSVGPSILSTPELLLNKE
jgi:hypothetical protein